ncbi:MAG: GTPase, partial [Halobacteriaceae archaeon]
MGLLTSLRDSITRVRAKLFTNGSAEPKRIGIYGPPNAGKTTLANRIARDWTGDAVGPESHIPHETRRARRKEGVEIERNGKTVQIDIVDTPGVTTKVDYEDFLEHDLEEEEAIRRSREATEGVAEAMHWLREDVDGVIYVLDS